MRSSTAMSLERIAGGQSRVLFAFPGGAGAWDGMGMALYRAEPSFKASVDACSLVAEGRLGFDAASRFRDVGASRTSPDFRTAWRNRIVLIGIVQIALSDLWQSAGIVPDGVLGLSLGTYAAAYAAGALSRSEVATVVCSVARTVSDRPKKGIMFQITGNVEAAKSLCQRAPVPLAFLGELSPQETLLIADANDASVNSAYLASSGRLVRQLPTDWTYHTTLQAFDRPSMLEDLKGIESRPSRLPIYSSASGGLLPEDTIQDGGSFHWGMSHPFYFGSAMTAALRDGFRLIVNVGPKPIMTPTLREAARRDGARVRFVDSMCADEPEMRTWRRALRQVSAQARANARPRRKRQTANGTSGAAATRLDLFAPEVGPDPSRYLKPLREAGAVHFLPRSDCWLVVGYDAVRSVLRTPNDYSHRDVESFESSLLGADGVGHATTRRLLVSRFSDESCESLGHYTDQIAEQLLVPLAGKPEFDTVSAFSMPLTDLLAARLLDLDDVALSAVRAQLGGRPRPSGLLVGPARAAIAPVAERIPLYADLVRRHEFDESVALGLIVLLWAAITGTTNTALSSSILLLRDHSVRREIEAEPRLLSAFVDESLRLHPPQQLISRTTIAEVTLAGVRIPQGSSVSLAIGAANRDPARFAAPDRLILDRPNSRDHLAFAAGPHHCLGARLARIIMPAALGTLLRVMPDFELVQPFHTLRYVSNNWTGTLEQLTIASG